MENEQFVQKLYTPFFGWDGVVMDVLFALAINISTAYLINAFLFKFS